MGKYLFSFGDIGLWELFRPIGIPILLGAIWNFFPNSIFLILSEILMVAFAVGYIYSVFLIGCELFGEKSGAFSGIVLALTPMFFINSGLLLSDIPSAFFIALAVLLAIRKKYFLAGVLGSAAFLTRFTHGLGLFAIAVVLVIPFSGASIKHFFRFVLGAALLIVPFLTFNYFMYRGETSNFAIAIIRPLILAAPHQYNPFVGSTTSFFYLAEMVKDNPLIVFAVAGLVFFFVRKLYSDRRTLFVFVPLVSYLIYFSSVANRQLRFSIAFLGFAAIVAAFGFVEIQNSLKSKWWRAIAALIFFALSLVPLYADWNYVGWRYTKEPAIVEEFYRLPVFSGGTVLTADPVPAAYSDGLFVPYYYSVKEGLVTAKDWIQMGKISHVIHKRSSFPCADGDAVCAVMREELRELITKNKLIFNKTYYNEEYLVYNIE